MQVDQGSQTRGQQSKNVRPATSELNCQNLPQNARLLVVCEQFFSSMKINKSDLRSRLTDEHLRATMRLATARDVKPNLDFLASSKRCELSSQTNDT